MNLMSGAAFTGVQLAETGFDVRSRRRNRPPAGPAKNKRRSSWSLPVQLRGADDGLTRLLTYVHNTCSTLPTRSPGSFAPVAGWAIPWALALLLSGHVTEPPGNRLANPESGDRKRYRPTWKSRL